MPAKTVLYRATATAIGGRNGTSKTHDGVLDLRLATPKELGGQGGEGVNPEQLFAAGYAACFLGALKFYAGQQKVKVPEAATTTVSVGIGPREDLGFGLNVDIVVDLPGLDAATAEDLIAGAHRVCPYSDATRNALSITPKLAVPA